MEINETDHIRGNLPELINKTIWHTSLKTLPMESGIFGHDEITELDAIFDERARILRFYELFMKKKNSYQLLMTTLEVSGQSGVVDILNKLNGNSPVAGTSVSQSVEFEEGSSLQSSQDNESKNSEPSVRQIPTGIQFDVIQPVRLFTGRVKELLDLHQKLQVVNEVTSIVGVGGIGKTELARVYIQNYGESYDNNVIWIHAETEETLRDSFRRLAADYLNIELFIKDCSDKSIEPIIEEVYKFFEDKYCLFVFDNAKSHENIMKFMPLQISYPPSVLITTRDRDCIFSVEILELDAMEEMEATDFVKKSLEILDDKQEHLVVQLVKTLQCFPLAISQAVSYIHQQQILKDYSICEYLHNYNKCSEKLLNCNLLSSEPVTYGKTIFTTWKMTMDVLSKNKDCGEMAINILNMFAYFQPDQIPIELLTGDTEKKLDFETVLQVGILSRIATFLGLPKIVLEFTTVQSGFKILRKRTTRALQLLVNYSMIRIHQMELTISIHPIVQEVTRIKLREENLEKITLIKTLSLLSESLSDFSDLNPIRHFCSVYKYCGAYRKVVVQFKSLPWKMLETDNNLILDTSSSHCGVRVGAELYETLQKHVFTEDVDVVRLKYMVLRANLAVGNYVMASNGFEKILPIYLENSVGMFTDMEILWVQYDLAICWVQLGRRAEGENMFLQIYQKLNTLAGLKNYLTMHVLLKIARYLQKLGYFRKEFFANAEYLKVVTNNVIVPKPLEIVSLLKCAYAHKMHRDDTESYRYAHCISVLANFFFNVGAYDIASTIANDLYKLGRDSNYKTMKIQSIQCLNILGAVKCKEGKDEEAFEYFNQAHCFSLLMLGDCHESTLECESNMLSQFLKLRQGDNALSGLRENLETAVTNYPNYSYAITTEMDIGIRLFTIERYDLSLALLIDLQKRIQQILGATDPLFVEVSDWIEIVNAVINV